MLMLPLVLIGPVMALAAVVVGLAAHGPAGWLAAAGLVLVVGWAGRAAWQRCCGWWASTKAPVRDDVASRVREGG